ncbi:MAG TPA: amidohydrolase [Nitrospirae bacterium]|nr:5-methylthioadenosine/S-adenosylhomocysteine deaminase [bacterium BMS3Abin06]HDH10600.1 amidohydrolase [Nitrospirota bacterium]HDZ00277.1 amidohydrolase [Nitrospirota bacterium]
MEKVDLIVRADYLITMEGDLSVINDGAVAVTGSTITDVGTFSDISGRYTSEKIIEGKKKVVFPGLINTHTHAAMVYFRGLADDLPLQEWLEKHIWPNEMKWLSSEFVNDAVELACLEMLKAGVTTYADMYFYEDTAARKLEKIGMRGVLGSGVIDFPWKDIAQSADDYFRHAEDLINNWKDSELITPCIAPHATFTCGPDNYKRAKEMADKHNVPLHTHLAETQFEVAECKKRYGKTPVEYLDDIGFLSERLFAAHCVWLTGKEIEILAEKKVGVSHCIESNLKLASGIAPLPKLLNAGVKVAFGTDGAASNNDLNILGEMSTAAKVHKAVSMDATIADSKTMLLMATKNGAEILGLGEKTGSIKPGKKADLIIAGLDQPHLTPIYDIYSHITYCMRPSDIETVMVNGKIVIDKGQPATLDEAGVIAKARAWREKIQEQ